jgi:hypothetical protein
MFVMASAHYIPHIVNESSSVILVPYLVSSGVWNSTLDLRNNSVMNSLGYLGRIPVHHSSSTHHVYIMHSLLRQMSQALHNIMARDKADQQAKGSSNSGIRIPPSSNDSSTYNFSNI